MKQRAFARLETIQQSPASCKALPCISTCLHGFFATDPFASLHSFVRYSVSIALYCAPCIDFPEIPAFFSGFGRFVPALAHGVSALAWDSACEGCFRTKVGACRARPEICRAKPGSVVPKLEIPAGIWLFLSHGLELERKTGCGHEGDAGAKKIKVRNEDVGMKKVQVRRGCRYEGGANTHEESADTKKARECGPSDRMQLRV